MTPLNEEQLPTTEEQTAAYENWLYMKHAKDATSEAYRAGYRTGFIAAKEKFSTELGPDVKALRDAANWAIEWVENEHMVEQLRKTITDFDAKHGGEL